MEIVIRPFRPADQDPARAIIQAGLAERWGETFDPLRNPDTNDLAKYYVDGGGTLLVATVDEQVVGVGALIRQGDGLGRIVRLSVAAPYRRRGLARQLVTGLVARARELQYHAVMVSTDTPWTDAVALYESAGFAVSSIDAEETHLWLDLIWTPVRITTERLIIRAPTRGDNGFVAELLTDPGTRTYLGGPASYAVVEWVKAHSLASQWGAFVLWLKDRPQRIGMVELEDWRGELEISCHLLPEYWSMGYAAEASAAVLAWAWSTLDADSIIAVTHDANAAALRTLIGLGFEVDTHFEEYGDPQTQLRLRRPVATDGGSGPISLLA